VSVTRLAAANREAVRGGESAFGIDRLAVAQRGDLDVVVVGRNCVS